MVIWPVLALEDWDISRRDGAHGDRAAAIAAAAARPSELELARIRHAGRLLAAEATCWSGVGATPTVTLNARVCESYPQVVQACLEAGWELNAHGYEQIPMHKLDDQRATIQQGDGRDREILRQARRAAGSGRA